MSGEKNLQKLLASMSPELMPGEYVFCTFKHGQYGDYAQLEPIASVREVEGLTLVVEKSMADEHSIPYESVFSLITLRVHSSLDAVGLTAAFAGRLAQQGISANVVAGYYHDHLFVQREAAQNALKALKALAAEQQVE